MGRNDATDPGTRRPVTAATHRPVTTGTHHPVTTGTPHPVTTGSDDHPLIPAHAGISGGLLTGLDAVLRGCLPGQPERLTALDAAIRAPLPLSTGVGVVGAGDAAPTGVVAGLLAGVLAARRPHRVLWVSGLRQARPAQGTRPPAGFRQDQPAGPQPADAARRATARTGDEATAGLGRTPSGAWTLELESPARWWDAVAPISRFFDFVVTDWGTPTALDDARAASSVVLVVTAADRDGLRAGVDLRARLGGSGLTALLAMHDLGTAPRGLAEAARVNGASWLPADRGLDGLDQRAGGLDELDRRKRRLRFATTIAALELTAGVVDAAVARNRAEAVA